MAANRKTKQKEVSTNTEKIEVNDKKKSGILASYNSALAKYPLLINSITAAILGGLGTLMSEMLKGGDKIDHIEIFIMMFINAVFNTPVLMWWFDFVDKMKGGVAYKTLVDQLLFSPVFTAAIIALRLFLIGTKVDDIVPTVIAVVPSAMKSSWLFWFPQKYISLSYFPPQHQLLFGNVCALVWNVIFSMILTAKK